MWYNGFIMDNSNMKKVLSMYSLIVKNGALKWQHADWEWPMISVIEEYIIKLNNNLTWDVCFDHNPH